MYVNTYGAEQQQTHSCFPAQPRVPMHHRLQLMDSACDRADMEQANVQKRTAAGRTVGGSASRWQGTAHLGDCALNLGVMVIGLDEAGVAAKSRLKHAWQLALPNEAKTDRLQTRRLLSSRQSLRLCFLLVTERMLIAESSGFHSAVAAAALLPLLADRSALQTRALEARPAVSPSVLRKPLPSAVAAIAQDAALTVRPVPRGPIET